MQKRSLKIIGILLLLTACGSTDQASEVLSENTPFTQEIEVNFSENPNRGDYGLSASYNDCQMDWFIFDSELNDQKYVEVIDTSCSDEQVSHSEVRDMQRALLAALFERWSIEDISSISWGMPMYDETHSWSYPIALASATSPEYADYRQNYPNAEINSINALFGKLAEETNAYQYTNALFNEFGAEIKLESIEKISTATLSDSLYLGESLKAQLIEAGLSEKDRVIYDAAVNYFKVEPL